MSKPTDETEGERRLRELHGKAMELRGELVRVQEKLGTVLLEMHREVHRERGLGRGYGVLGSTTFPLYCEKVLRIGTLEGYRLRAAAETFESDREVRDTVLEGGAPLASASILGYLYRYPALLRGDDRWAEAIRDRTTREVRSMVEERRRVVGVQSPVKVSLSFTPGGWAGMKRARELVSRTLQRPVLLEESLEFVVNEFLDRHDPERKAERVLGRVIERLGKRPRGGTGGGGASPDTPVPDPGDLRSRALDLLERRADADAAGVATGGEGHGKGETRSRHIPNRVKHAKILRDGDRCCVDGCDERCFLDFAHRTQFARGGGHGRVNLFRYCRTHHRQRDAGMWKEVRAGDGWILVDPHGTVVGKLRGPP